PNYLFQLTGADHVWPAPVDVLRRADHVWPGADVVWPGADAVGPALRDPIPILPVRESTSSLLHRFSSLLLDAPRGLLVAVRALLDPPPGDSSCPAARPHARSRHDRPRPHPVAARPLPHAEAAPRRPGDLPLARLRSGGDEHHRRPDPLAPLPGARR